MNTEQQRRWREADQALDRLLDLPPAQRGAALAALSDDIRTLTAQLLAAHEGAGVLDQPLPSAPGSPTAEALLDLPGVPRVIGPWRLGEVIGRGGMSIVYAATRELSAGSQQAALKLLTVAALAADGRRRFLREHQVLARLAHPRIAALLDAGVLDDGTPYLAMQRIHGLRLDAWCEQHALPPRAIVTLFQQVCDAVAHAHRQLVVHRDLKPANILVDGEGQVRLLDFGIARLLDDAVEAESTRTEFRALTPQYAAPEQFRGEDSGTAADVFGLGAVLYQLLTGRPPRAAQQGHEAAITQPSRAVASAQASATSRRALFARQLRGDLDAILLKALEADPARRYPDAASMADDLRRWLQARPVRAARAGRGYRLRKFVARHRAGVAAAGLVALALVAAVASTLWHDAKVREEAARATAVKDFMLDIFRASGPDQARGTDPPASELLRMGASRVQADLAGRPRVLAEMLQVIGGIQLERGLVEDARQSLDAALALFEGAAAGLEDAHEEALLARAMTEYELGSPSGAAQRFRALRQRILARDSEDASRLPKVELDLADMLLYLREIDEARAMADTARARIEQGGDASTHPDYPAVLRMQGLVRHWSGDPEGAVPLLQAAAEVQHRQDPGAPLASTIQNDLGISLLSTGRTEDAEAALTRALEAQRLLLGAAHPATIASGINVAMVRAQLGRHQEAIALAERALLDRRAQFGSAPHVDLAHSLGVLGLLHWQAGDAAAAEPLAAESVAMLARIPASDALDLGWITLMLDLLHMEQHGAIAPDGPMLRSCTDLQQANFLTLRACVARGVAAAQQGECDVPSAVPPESPASVDAPWWTAWWHLQARCAPDAGSRVAAAAEAARLHATLDAPPAWLDALARP